VGCELGCRSKKILGLWLWIPAWVCGCGFRRGSVAVDSGVGCWVIDRRCGLCWVLVCVVVGSCCREVWLGKPGKKKKNIFYNILI
jgi:hypothetical protein